MNVCGVCGLERDVPHPMTAKLGELLEAEGAEDVTCEIRHKVKLTVGGLLIRVDIGFVEDAREVFDGQCVDNLSFRLNGRDMKPGIHRSVPVGEAEFRAERMFRHLLNDNRS